MKNKFVPSSISILFRKADLIKSDELTATMAEKVLSLVYY